MLASLDAVVSTSTSRRSAQRLNGSLVIYSSLCAGLRSRRRGFGSKAGSNERSLGETLRTATPVRGAVPSGAAAISAAVANNGILATSREFLHMTRKFKVGDHVCWNSEAGYVSGTIIKVHTKDADYRGYTHHASVDEPQYEIQSDKSDHVAMHKGAALRKID